MEAPPGSQAAHPHPPHHHHRPYVLRELIRNVPLGEHEDGSKAYITSVDTWNGNLYIGTSAGDVLHYVSLPGEEQDAPPSYIFATKLHPPYTSAQEGPDRGVKQILLLPHAQKACLLSNTTLTFYTLPELSPAFAGKIKQPGCLYVGGIDSMEHNYGGNAAYGTAIVICLRQRLRLIRIGEEARKIRDIELGGVGGVVRREDLACVADGEGKYCLLDVVNQRKNELFAISSSPASEADGAQGTERAEVGATQPVRNREASKSFSSRSPIRLGRGHERNVSLGAQPKNNDHLLRPDSNSRWSARSSSHQASSPTHPSSREHSPPKLGSGEASTRTSTEAPRDPPIAKVPPPRPLPPNIVSPTPTEFLLTTGTNMDEPGVGIFVNLEGDVVRGTIEFSSYPTSLVLDGRVESAAGDTSTELQTGAQEGYVLAVVRRRVNGEGKLGPAIEIQRWDGEAGEGQAGKQWIGLPTSSSSSSSCSSAEDLNGETSEEAYGIGLRRASTSVQLAVPEISTALRLRRLRLSSKEDADADTKEEEADAKRNKEEDQFVARLAHVPASVLLYHGDRVSWVVRNALVVQLDTQLNAAVHRTTTSTNSSSSRDSISIDVPAVQNVINTLRGQDPTTELDFLTLTYIRQKASLLLFGNLVLQTAAGVLAYERDKRVAEEALVAGEVDPRVILSLVPPLGEEVDEGEGGVWGAQGLGDMLGVIRGGLEGGKVVQDPKGAYGDNLLQLTKRYLFAWRKKKGFGSIADETHVSRTVDAALLHVLLLLDQSSPRGPATAGSVRAELNDVVDRGVDCFERAIELFEREERLYMLSRLYQSRKMTAKVLGTWKRILDGERDAGGEMVEGEMDVRKYLAKLRDPSLVQDYGAWLANRNPKLGVQVFADDAARVKIQPQEAVGILKAKAPGAVKHYLEHLVFGKKQGVRYVGDLVAFYLDAVLAELKRDGGGARGVLRESYETYRALRSPKPTYRQFVTDNAVDAEWWQNRLRLLQLLGGGHGASTSASASGSGDGAYDVHALGARLAPYSEELVPEMIILNAREGKHSEALRLLAHGLGDYETAIRYCLLGGSQIFHPSSSNSNLTGTAQPTLPTKEDQARLFTHLLHEFLSIDDLSERLERTAELLERFGGWFDVSEVLEAVPGEWSVEILRVFLVRSLRRLVGERRETGVVKALCGAQNLGRVGEWVGKVEGVGARVVRGEAEAG